MSQESSRAPATLRHGKRVGSTHRGAAPAQRGGLLQAEHRAVDPQVLQVGYRRSQHIVGTAWRRTIPSSILGPKGEGERARRGLWHTDGSSIALFGGAVPGIEDGGRLVSDETDLRRQRTKDATRRDGRGVRRSYISWPLRCCRATPQWQQATAAHHNDPEHHRRHTHRAYAMRHTSVSSLCLDICRTNPTTPVGKGPTRQGW